MKNCYIIAGANGSGKTTFAKTFLMGEVDCDIFINADLIAAGLSPLKPEFASMEAGRVMLAKIEDAVAQGKSFSFESTLSGLSYVRRIRRWKEVGYRISIYFLTLDHVDLAVQRVGLRTKTGGHYVPEVAVRRRFDRARQNFEQIYKALADSWIIFDNSGNKGPILLERSDERTA